MLHGSSEASTGGGGAFSKQTGGGSGVLGIGDETVGASGVIWKAKGWPCRRSLYVMGETGWQHSQ